MNFSIVEKDGKRCVYLISDPPQYLTAADLENWMREVRDVDMDLFNEIFHAYNLLKKSPASDTRNARR